MPATTTPSAAIIMPSAKTVLVSLLVILVLLALCRHATAKPQVFGGGGGFGPGLSGGLGFNGGFGGPSIGANFGLGYGPGGSGMSYQQGFQESTAYQHASSSYSNLNSGAYGFGRR